MSDIVAEAKTAPLSYTDMGTLVRERERFDSSCNIPIESFASLVAATQMREDLACQLEYADGSRCNQPHHSGWLAKRKDGVEGLIGGICADKHFNASERFRTERARLSREIAIESHLAALSGLLRDRPAVARRARAMRESLSAMRGVLREIEGALPYQVVGLLRDMVKRGNRGQVDVEVLYVEKDEKGREENKWRVRNVGTIAGLAAWNATNSTGLYSLLCGIEFALTEAVLSKDAGLPKLRAWREALEKLPYCEQQAAMLERALADFARPENIGLLCHLVRNQDRQRDIAALVLKRSGVERPSSFKIQDGLNQIHQQVRDQYGGRPFRVLH